MTEFENLEFETIAELTERYLRGDLDPEKLAQLEQTLLSDETSARMFLEVLLQAGTMREVFAEQHRFGQQIGEASPEAYFAFLRSLGPTHEVEPVQWVGENRPGPTQGVLRWLKQPTALIGVGIAAALAIAITLVLVFSGPNQPGGATVVESPGQFKQAFKQVATLSATSNAKWSADSAEGVSAPGSPLHAGDRLTLTHGFAEITTNDGAVAILEAPATIELIDNDNAIYLHAGKLVGICETASSEGFLVRTPHMDIVDLGTRFGVDTSAKVATEVHVFSGSVRATRSTEGAQPPKRVLLQTGEAIRASGSGDAMVVVQSDKQRFAAIGLADMRLFRGTGEGLSAGTIDPRWQVVAIGEDLLDEPVAMRVSDRLFNSNRLALAVSGAKYLILREEIVPDIANYIVDKRIRYTIQTTLHLPVDFDPAKADLVIQFEADDRLSMVRVNGRETAAPPNRFVLEDPKLYRVIIPGSQLKPGPNAVELEVSDLIRSNSYAWGFGVAWHLGATDQERPKP